MDNIQKNSDNEKLINANKKIPKFQEIDGNLLSKEISDKSILNDSKKEQDRKNILLNTLVNIKVELGQSKIKIKDFLNFSKGSMLILDKTQQDPLDIFINGHLIASGEIVVSEKKYGIRITSIKSSVKTIDVASEI